MSSASREPETVNRLGRTVAAKATSDQVELPELSWEADDRFSIGDTRFRILPAGGFVAPGAMERKDADFLIVKRRPGVERYVRLIEELRPKRIFELGIFQGGSTALLAELARPQRLVAIDKRAVPGAVEEYAARRGLRDVVRTYGGWIKPIGVGSRPSSRRASRERPSISSSMIARTSTRRPGRRSTSCFPGCGLAVSS